MHFEVLLTEDANRDLEGIYPYVAEHDARERPRSLSAASFHELFVVGSPRSKLQPSASPIWLSG